MDDSIAYGVWFGMEYSFNVIGGVQEEMEKRA